MFPQSKITDTLIKQAVPKAKPYKLAAGGALYIHVSPNAGKHWRMKYRFMGKEKTFTIGAYPDISIKQAIQARNEAKALLAEGIDPNQVKQDEAKNRAKPENLKAQFRMEVSDAGKLTIETETRIITLTKPQVSALRSFLAALPMEAPK